MAQLGDVEAGAGCPSCKLFVGGLSARTTTEMLQAHFSKYGMIVDAVVMTKQGRPRGFGFVTWEHAESAAQALHEAQCLDGRFVDLKPAVREPPQEQTPNKVFVGGLPQDTTTEDLRTCFQAYGPIVDAVVMVDRRTKRSRGFGFIRFASGVRGAKAAEAVLVDAEQHSLHGKWVEVKRATPAPLGEEDDDGATYASLSAVASPTGSPPGIHLPFPPSPLAAPLGYAQPAAAMAYYGQQQQQHQEAVDQATAWYFMQMMGGANGMDALRSAQTYPTLDQQLWGMPPPQHELAMLSSPPPGDWCNAPEFHPATPLASRAAVDVPSSGGLLEGSALKPCASAAATPQRWATGATPTDYGSGGSAGSTSDASSPVAGDSLLEVTTPRTAAARNPYSPMKVEFSGLGLPLQPPLAAR